MFFSSCSWSYLAITDVRKKEDGVSDDSVAYLAGWVELNLTVSLVEMQWENTMTDYCSQKIDICKKIDDFLESNKVFTDESMNSSVPLWYQV